jgi:tRNA pseudouridine38-40 synthase
VIGSGRTDTGVHAAGQVASVDLPARWSAQELHRALNAVLPEDIWVADVRRVSGGFHPRYDAVARTYAYRLGTEPESRSPFHRGWCWALCKPVEPALLEAAARPLVGTRSFRAFAKSGQPERGERCSVQAASWAPWAPLGHVFTITADRYLHHMVRYLVGTMVDIARGRRPVADMSALLEGEASLETSPPAPPEGLFLQRVEYAEAADGTSSDHVEEDRPRPSQSGPDQQPTRAAGTRQGEPI